MRTPKQRHSHEEWEKTVEDVDLQIAQLAIMCHVRLLDPGVIERVLDNDLRICGDGHESGFEKLCGILLDDVNMFGYCYTQLTDVYQEHNGIYKFDRSGKFDMERIRAAQIRPAAIEKANES